MTKEQAIELLKKGAREVFNQYRESNPNWIPDLSGADLSSINLLWGGALDLRRANLCGTILASDQTTERNTRKSIFKTRANENATENHAIIEDAIIDINTKGPSLDYLVNLGAKFDYNHIGQSQQQIQVFISYAWANSDVVLAIDQWLRNKGLSTKIDKRDFFAGSRIKDEISRTMKESNVVLIFHSQVSKTKPWVEFEQELADDIQMSAKVEGKNPPRIIYLVMDGTPLPNISAENRLAIMAKGKRFELVCEELYHHILQIPRNSDSIDLSKWENYTF